MEIIDLLKNGLLAGIIAGTLNVVIYFIAKQMSWVSNSVLLPGGKPLTLLPIIFSSVIPSILAAVTLFALDRMSDNPISIFTIIGIVILLLSLGGPFSIPRLPTSTRLTLALMHLIAGGVIIYFLRK